MNRSNKLFIAAVLLAAGYGVASLLGSPNTPYLWHPPQEDQAAAKAAPPFVGDRAAVDRNRAVGEVRLLPDLSSNASPPSISAETVERRPAEVRRLAPIGATPISDLSSVGGPSSVLLPNLLDTAPASPSNVYPPPELLSAAPTSGGEERQTLRAKFSDAPPRPLRINERAEVLTTTVAPPPEFAKPTSPTISLTGRDNAAPAVKAEPPKNERPAEISAAYSSNIDQTAAFRPMTLPPPPRVEAAPRTHIIVDGDSLPKLAKRYLKDPQRSDEIYAANRKLLKSPDLLPIGAELTIPAAAKANDRGD